MTHITDSTAITTIIYSTYITRVTEISDTTSITEIKDITNINIISLGVGRKLQILRSLYEITERNGSFPEITKLLCHKIKCVFSTSC